MTNSNYQLTRARDVVWSYVTTARLKGVDLKYMPLTEALTVMEHYDELRARVRELERENARLSERGGDK
jgi:hypothetical protein